MKFRCMIVIAVCLVLFSAMKGGVARADVSEVDGNGDARKPVHSYLSADEEIEYADLDENGSAVEEKDHPSRHLSLLTGYRLFSTDRYGGRAATYEDLRSGMTGSASLGSLDRYNKLTIDGAFNTTNDYSGDVVYDHRGIYRLNLRTESLFHNLDHVLLPSGFTNLSGVQYLFRDNDAGARYGLRVEQDQAEFRYKVPTYPLHVNIGYWRMAKDGTTQLRFADQAFEAPTSQPVNTLYSMSRKIDRQIHEGHFGLDANLGPLDFVYLFTIRQSVDSVSTPADFFLDRSSPKLVMQRIPGIQQHNEDPESRYLSHTVKLHTSIAGGLVGAASYTFGLRENLSQLSDVVGADQTRNYLHNVAADLFYTPFQELSLALKYRRQEVKRSGPSTIIDSFGIPSLLHVRSAITTEKNMITATASYRPIRDVTIKGEFRGEFLDRSNLSDWNRPGIVESFNMATDYDQYKGIVTVLARPMRSMRLKGEYSYTTANRPDYGTSPLERHEGQIFVTYNLARNWGMTANYRIVDESNDQLTMSTLDLVNSTVPPYIPLNFDTYRLPRHGSKNNVTASLWFSPMQSLTLSGSYGLTQSVIDQSIIFSGPVKNSNASSSYTGQSQYVSVDAIYHHDEMLDLSLGLQHIRSYSRFSPDFIAPRPGLDTAGISDISRVDTVEYALSPRADYHLSKNLLCSVSYSYRDYHDKVTANFSGTVHTIAASVGGNW